MCITPSFTRAPKTYLYEVYEQLGRLPENIVIPVGNGTLFLGVMHGLDELIAAGLVDKAPQIIALQTETCDPLLQAAERGLDHPADICPTPTIAEGISIGKPMRGGEILAYARKYGVRFVHAPEDEILPAREALAKQGIYCEHTTAANYAAYLNYCRLYGDTPDTLITMCGAGLKSDH
jgi:Threonine synthase